MAEERRDLSRATNEVVPETESGTTKKSDQTSWDSGREASITRGTSVETDTRAADAETSGVNTRPAGPPIEPEKQ